MHGLKVIWIGQTDPMMPIFRLARAVWQRGRVGDGSGYSAKLTVGLRPKMWQWNHGSSEWAVTLLGVRWHYRRSYGGIDV